jgi:hypothetical protein
MIRRFLLIVLMGLHHAEAAAADIISLSPEVWHIQFSQGMLPHPTSQGSGWSFDFPRGTECKAKENCPGVRYVTTSYRKPIIKSSTLTVTFEIVTQGKVRFNYKLEPSNTCSSPATVRAFLQCADDHLYAANGRFWSNPIATILEPGTFTMAIKLNSDQWTNVEGQNDRAGFEALLSKIGNVGITFGGGCFFGHGVNVGAGSARFVMTGFVIQ